VIVSCTLCTWPYTAKRQRKCTRQPINNKPFLIWLLTSPVHLNYVTTLLCNLSLIACFLALMFRQVVWQHLQGVLVVLITIDRKFTTESFSEKNVNRLRFDRILSLSLWPRFFAHPVCKLYCFPLSSEPSRVNALFP